MNALYQAEQTITYQYDATQLGSEPIYVALNQARTLTESRYDNNLYAFTPATTTNPPTSVQVKKVHSLQSGGINTANIVISHTLFIAKNTISTMITTSKIGYWKMAYFFTPALATLVVQALFAGWSNHSLDGTIQEEFIFLYVFFTWLFSCSISLLVYGIALGVAVLMPLSYLEVFQHISIYLLPIVFLILGYFQWFYLLPKWLRWRRERAEE